MAEFTIPYPADPLFGVDMDDRYEMVVCERGLLELRDRDDPECWIATDSPIELEP